MDRRGFYYDPSRSFKFVPDDGSLLIHASLKWFLEEGPDCFLCGRFPLA